MRGYATIWLKMSVVNVVVRRCGVRSGGGVVGASNFWATNVSRFFNAAVRISILGFSCGVTAARSFAI